MGVVEIGDCQFRSFNPRPALYERGLTYNKQGAIFFACKNFFSLLNLKEQHKFEVLLDELCKHNKEWYMACFEYLTGESSARVICKDYHISLRQLYYIIDDFYLNFEYVKKVY